MRLVASGLASPGDPAQAGEDRADEDEGGGLGDGSWSDNDIVEIIRTDGRAGRHGNSQPVDDGATEGVILSHEDGGRRHSSSEVVHRTGAEEALGAERARDTIITRQVHAAEREGPATAHCRVDRARDRTEERGADDN